MRPSLLFPDGGIDPEADLPVHVEEILDDLEIPTLLRVMCGGDEVIHDACRRVLLQCCTDVDVVIHRQQIFADCAAHEQTVRDLYALACDTLRQEHAVFRSVFAKRPEAMLRHGVQVFKIFATSLHALRDGCRRIEQEVTSPGMQRLCASIRENLDDTYLQLLSDHIQRLQLKDGLLVGGRLTPHGATTGMIVRTPREENRTLFHRNAIKRPTYSFTIPERDDAGFRSLSEFRDRGLADIAWAAEQSADDVHGFFRSLQLELGFYVGGLNLVHELDHIGVRTCVPNPAGPDTQTLAVERLQEVALALESRTAPVPADLKAGGTDLVIITGANRGGKSTMLRALGLAHLMMQAGLPVAAESFTASLRRGVFTHFKREEDEGLTSGKFDEELRRMSAIVHDIRTGSLLLCNESFSATNEAEGSQVGFDTVTGLADAGVTVVLVTHMYDLSRSFHDDGRPAVFLRAERGESGERPYRLIEAPPLPTSYGGDVFAKVFGYPPTADRYPGDVAARQ